jgi:hypothetical protein
VNSTGVGGWACRVGVGSGDGVPVAVGDASAGDGEAGEFGVSSEHAATTSVVTSKDNAR